METSAGQSTNLSLDLSYTVTRVGNIVIFDFPLRLKITPESITLNGNNFWLINSSADVDKNDVVSWDIVPGKLTLRFKTNTLSPGDVVVLRLVPDRLRLATFKDLKISAYDKPDEGSAAVDRDKMATSTISVDRESVKQAEGQK